MKRLTLIAALVLCGCATPAPGPSPIAESKGRLTDAKGMTLYTFKKDGPGTSSCYGNCAKTWPPFVVLDRRKATQELTVVARNDGQEQWAFKGQPLYRYVGDSEAGQANGEGNGGTWYTVRRNPPSAGAAATPSY